MEQTGSVTLNTTGEAFEISLVEDSGRVGLVVKNTDQLAPNPSAGVQAQRLKRWADGNLNPPVGGHGAAVYLA